MKKRNDQLHNDPWDRDYYGTGSTQPPKNHGGVIAGLLIAVIVLGSITTGLGILNIQLFRMLRTQNQAEKNIQLIQPQTTDPADHSENAVTEGTSAAALGLDCATVTEFDARFYRLPYGCLVTRVAEDACTDKAGICTGDVIVSFNGRTIQSVEELSGALAECHAGESVSIVVYRTRTNRHVTLKVILDERGEKE